MTRILMPLLDEGTDTWRPVEACHVSESFYRVEDVPLEGERWAFAPGTIVRCEMRTFSDGGAGLAAVEVAAG